MRQKLHYTEIAWAYIVSAVAIPILFILPSIALLFNLHVVANESVYLFFRIPSLAAILYFYYVLSGKSFSAGQFWASLSFVYLKALILSLLPFKIKYKVTNKFAGPKKRDIALILPHMALILFAAIAVMWRIFYADRAITSFTGINILWMTLMIFWFTPIIRKGFLIE